MATTARQRGEEIGSVLDQYLGDIARYPLVSRATEDALARRIQAGDEEALDALVRANLRFVVSIAKGYRNRGVLLADLIAEGNVGLMRAARRFDPDHGVKFITYAVWWIRRSVLQALAEQSHVVRVPPNRAGALHRVGRRERALEQRLGRAPTAAEIAEAMDLPLAEVRRALALPRAHVSLDRARTAEEGAPLVDRLADDGAATDAALLERTLGAAVEASFKALRPREARVLRLYFGFDGEPMSLEQIGAAFGITRERARQIKLRALMRLRESPAATPLAQLAR